MINEAVVTRFLLRIGDTDAVRSRPEHATQLLILAALDLPARRLARFA